MPSTSDDEVREVAREAARAEVRRLFEKVVYFLAGVSLLCGSFYAPSAVAGADSTVEATVTAGIGLFFLGGGVYLLAYVFDVDRRVARWLRNRFA
ncbi:hypothetical protein [Halocalculus aciditolerans]|uniref:Uncharacterized protein n=1 Tax=Halocalculus aciditolerans TaxID=1383812 RepID=A0A830FFR0_9EURY|nr:hypothetical protein [Halocalculus aciditolerans]GGL48725.1 hypothetical protein GCM10009039_03660 [Halocalculus aciditolerans]